MPIFPRILFLKNSPLLVITSKVQKRRLPSMPTSEILKRVAHVSGIIASCVSAVDLIFEKTYGELGKNFIHVHHIRPLRTLGEGYCINPVTNLIPLCPNCHAMIHRGNEVRPLPVDDLRKMLRN